MCDLQMCDLIVKQGYWESFKLFSSYSYLLFLQYMYSNFTC